MMKSEKVFIRKANLEDLDLVMQIIKSCTQDMISKKIYQWNDNCIQQNIKVVIFFTHFAIYFYTEILFKVIKILR